MCLLTPGSLVRVPPGTGNGISVWVLGLIRDDRLWFEVLSLESRVSFDYTSPVLDPGP